MIQSLRIEINRNVEPGNGEPIQEMRISVYVHDKKLTRTAYFIWPELTSYFDQIWEVAGNELKAVLAADVVA